MVSSLEAAARSNRQGQRSSHQHIVNRATPHDISVLLVTESGWVSASARTIITHAENTSVRWYQTDCTT